MKIDVSLEGYKQVEDLRSLPRHSSNCMKKPSLILNPQREKANAL